MKMQINIKAKKSRSKRALTYVVEAEVFGPVAVHEDLWNVGWRITHIKTGYSLLQHRLVDRRGAVALAKKIAKRPDLFEHMNTKDLSKNHAAIQYVHDCMEKTKSAQRYYPF